MLYGRLRLGAGTKTVTVTRQLPKHGWERIDTLKIDGRSSFTRTIPHVSGTLYRLGYPKANGKRATSIAVRAAAGK